MARVLKALDGKIVFGRKVSILSECGFASTGTGVSVNDRGSAPGGGEQFDAVRQTDTTDFDESTESLTYQDLPGTGES